jgi:hypothetical protein
VSIYQTETLPQPIAIDAVVVSDVASRSLGVRLGERTNGYEKMWWGVAHRALKAAMENGWGQSSSLEAFRRSDPYVWASTSTASRVAPVLPADFSMLQVTFPVGTAGFGELISKPGLYALATVDRNGGRFMSVKFLNRP